MTNIVDFNEARETKLKHNSTGIKYEATKYLTTSEIITFIMKDIQLAKMEGFLESCTEVKIKLDEINGMDVIDVEVLYFAGQMYCDQYLEVDPFDLDEFPHSQVYSDELSRTLDRLSIIVDSYNKNNYDLAKNFYNVRFHDIIHVNHEFAESRLLHESKKYAEQKHYI